MCPCPNEKMLPKKLKRKKTFKAKFWLMPKY